ncbi:hypothetical protein FOL47_010621 [Perkinsus chesapeaki]|uniref:Uncharacterized protein n=1 Tax=Perkinsus chesapeaki TaxID=330153 RepID=A0A7J6MP75_PERCH|nr:hypothetical protein FOL47_010621 [Perkinsus chesapeaki]
MRVGNAIKIIASLIVTGALDAPVPLTVHDKMEYNPVLLDRPTGSDAHRSRFLGRNEHQGLTDYPFYGRPHDPCEYNKINKTFEGSCSCRNGQELFVQYGDYYGLAVCTPISYVGTCPPADPDDKDTPPKHHPELGRGLLDCDDDHKCLQTGAGCFHYRTLFDSGAACMYQIF